MEVKLCILGQVPGGKNAVGITRAGRHYPKKRFTEWRDSFFGQARSQTNVRQLHGPLTAYVDIYFQDKRVRDVPGMMDAIWHALERANIIENDKWIRNVVWRDCGLDKARSRAEIVLKYAG